MDMMGAKQLFLLFNSPLLLLRKIEWIDFVANQSEVFGGCLLVWCWRREQKKARLQGGNG